MADNPKLETLARADRLIELPSEALGEVADLVLRLHQRRSRAHGAILSQHQQRTYLERSDTEQLGMRSAVQHVVDALLLLEIVELKRP